MYLEYGYLGGRGYELWEADIRGGNRRNRLATFETTDREAAVRLALEWLAVHRRPHEVSRVRIDFAAVAARYERLASERVRHAEIAALYRWIDLLRCVGGGYDVEIEDNSAASPDVAVGAWVVKCGLGDDGGAADAHDIEVFADEGEARAAWAARIAGAASVLEEFAHLYRDEGDS